MANISESRKETLDKDLDKLVHVEEATSFVSRGLIGPGLGLLFLAIVAVLYYPIKRMLKGGKSKSARASDSDKTAK